MIKPSTLAACLATIAFAVPAGLQVSGADIQTDGPKVAPAVEPLHVDDATVTVQVDRGVVATGGTVSAILVASSDRPHVVTVDMTTMQDMGMGGERVPNPPLEVDRRKVVLQALPGGGPPVVASVKLGSRRDGAGITQWYDVYVRQHGKHGQDEPAAHAGIVTWSGNPFPATIEPPASIPAEGPFTVALRVKNTTKAPLNTLDPVLGGRFTEWNAMARNYEVAADDYDVEPIADPNDDDTPPLAVGAERVFLYRVTPKRAGISHFTFAAHVRADNGAGAMDIAAFERPTPTVAEPATPSLAAR